MKKEIMERWVEALRDPNTRQGSGRLEDQFGKQCCLGVLCRIAEKENVVQVDIVFDPPTSPYYTTEVRFTSTGNTDDSSQYDLPDSVMRWAEIKTCCGEIEELNTDLSILNDNNKSFQEIADIIEEHWEKL